MREFALASLSFLSVLLFTILVTLFEIGRDFMRRDKGVGPHHEGAQFWSNASDIAAVIVAVGIWLGMILGLGAAVAVVGYAISAVAQEVGESYITPLVVCDTADQIREVAQAESISSKIQEINSRTGKPSCADGVLAVKLAEKLGPVKVRTMSKDGVVSRVEVFAWQDGQGKWHPVPTGDLGRFQYAVLFSEKAEEI